MSKAAVRSQQSDSHDSLDATASKPSSKPKRIRTYLPRRPRTFPTVIRQKLSFLGHEPPSNDTSRQNLGYLIDRLTTDLENYRILADHWQQKVTDLKHAEGDESSTASIAGSAEGLGEQSSNSVASSGCEACSSRLDSLSACSSCSTHPNSPGSHTPDLILDLQSDDLSSPRALEDSSAFGTHLIGHLNATANPSLSMVQVSAPRLRSNVSNLVSESTFQIVLAAIDTMAVQYLKSATGEDTWPMIRHLKPDFNLEKARLVWQSVFAPMDVSPSQISYNSGASCRKDSHLYNDDSDMDELDMALARATDLEVVDMLHYSSLMTGGMHQAVFDDPSLSAARLHLGRSSERLLREAVFTRNLTTNAQVAQALLDGFVGTFMHFTAHGMASAVISILELSWLVLTQHPSAVHHSLHVFITLFSVLLAPSQSKRATWMQRGMAVLEQSKQDRCFQTIVMGYYGAAYYALLTHDEDSVLSYATLLEDLLAPGTHHALTTEAWDVAVYHPVLPGTHPKIPSPSDTAAVFDTSGHFRLYEEPAQFESLGEPMLDDPTLDFWLPSSFPTDLHPPVPPVDDSSTESNQFLDEHGRVYTPGENLKSVLRISLQLMRAEASLIFQNQESCMYWVDEAEKTLRSIPLKYMFQRVLLLKNVIKATCPFPTGTRTVVDEFERRMIELDIANCTRIGLPPRDPRHLGALWRTP